MTTSLVIMAAGIGSRFGEGIKQLEPIGYHNEIIMDYSIHDAIKAGFNKIVIIIRKDIEEAFKEIIGNRIERICKDYGIQVYYAFQDINNVPENARIPSERSKPLGTGHAVLAAKEIIQEPFCVINADDYYGCNAFRFIYDFLINNTRPNAYCMAGFILKNTLSDNGSVTRGICQVENGMLTNIHETHNIIKSISGAEADGASLDMNSYVSMNMWGLMPEYLELLDRGFIRFFDDMKAGKFDPMKGEYLLPDHIAALLQKKEISVKILPTEDKWFGVTYKADKPVVVNGIRKLIQQGMYAERLYTDL
ncbi:MAG: sugar phosphate nucleotidyltransferase [Eubacterium sp.]|nr:sugar phosphate nucleotidyltransferase [Eubacterium sp.]